MNKLKIALAGFALIAFGGLAIGQGQGLFANYPVVGGPAYCSSFGNNNTCNNTVPAGPASLTGNETFIANTNLSQGRSPQTVLVKPAAFGANPISFVTVDGAIPAGISASNINGGVVYTSAATITSANITLPTNATNGQIYYISANRNITTLSVTAASGDSLATNTAPTALTASTTSPNGYTFICEKSSSACIWHRVQ